MDDKTRKTTTVLDVEDDDARQRRIREQDADALHCDN